MAMNVHNNFSFNFKHILIDEIALNGLEGIGFTSLWNRVEKRISSPVTMKMKARFWKTILSCPEISFYQNPEPVECVEALDRFQIVHQETGHLTEPDVYLDGEYEYHPVDGQYGSSVHFLTRIPQLRESLQQLSYETMEDSEYMAQLVMVASLEERWRALADHKPISYLAMLNPVHYCILELVGKGRENGQMTQGKTNLIKIVKDSKFLFYNRNFLQKQDLIRAQHLRQKINDKLAKIILLRLKRFHQPPFLSSPRVGKLRFLIDYLMDQPDHADKTQDMIKSGLLTNVQCKRLQKTLNVFDFEEREEPPKSPTPGKKKARIVKKKYIKLTCPSDSESSDSEVEIEERPCQYKVGVTLMRQAYEMLVEAGLKGLTQIELGQQLGVEFYTSRNVCKVLKSNNKVREFLEDKGKQRTARFISVNATKEMEIKYENEKQKLLNFMSESMTSEGAESTASSSKRKGDEHDSDKPNKKPKFENENEEMSSTIVPDINVIEREVTEVKVIEGLENFKGNSLLTSKKNLTLRQLRFANGVIKVLREKLAVPGYWTLSTLVAKEINEPPLDAKRLKMFIQKLITDGQVKILKMKWPGPNQNYTHLLCAPHVMPTDQVIVTKYRELCFRALKFKKKQKRIRVKPDTDADFIPVFLHTYPKYMKIQKLHELLIKLVYFERENSDLANSDNPEGFASLVYLIPEMTVESAMCNMKQSDLADLLHSKSKIDKEYYNVKLKDTPADIYNLFLNTPGLQDNLKHNLKLLSYLGLLQLVKEPNQRGDNIILSYSFYVNRNASILDTTGKWPRPGDHQHLERTYRFDTFSDVERYWQDVYNISIKTKILVESKDRQRKKYIPIVRMNHEVVANDNGQRHGNGLGPCGFDASFFMDAPRFWSTFYCNIKKKHQLQLKQPFKIAKKENKLIMKSVTIPKAPTRTRARARKTKLIPKPKANPKPKSRLSCSSMRWSPLEDQVLMLSKAAVTVMSPVAQPGSLRVRNLVCKDVLAMRDPNKQAKVCHLRAQALENNTTLTYQKECLINELRHRENLIRKYDGLLKKIKLRHAGNATKFINEARVRMMELMWVLYQIHKSESYNKKTPCAALSYQKFHNDFTICPASSNKGINFYHTPLDVDPKIAALKEGMIMCVMLSFQNEQSPEVANKVLEMFNQYPETTLRVVIEQVRKCGAVAAREKLFNCLLSKAFLQEIVQSSYKVSACYQRKWICKMNSDFVDKLTACLDQEIYPPHCGVKGSPEINCFLSELHANDALDMFSVSVPVITGSSGSLIQEEQMSVGDMLMKYGLKTGTTGWTPQCNVEKFSQIFGDIEFEDSFKELARNSTVEVTQQIKVDKTALDQNIIFHLKEKKETGSTFPELQRVTGYSSKMLCEQLKALESAKVVKRIGYYENLVILTEFAKAWTLTLGEKEIIPAPWLTLEQDKIRRDICLKWAGVVVNTAFSHPGCSIAYLSECCEFLTTRSAQDLCVMLEKLGCVKLNTMIDTKADWLSEDDTAPRLEEFNEYQLVGNIVVFPVKDSLTRFAYVRNKILEDYGKQ